MSSSATAPDVPPVSFSFSMLDMVVLYNAVSYIFMCRNKQFIVNISTERLRGEGGLADTFYKFKEDDLNDPDVYFDFETWSSMRSTRTSSARPDIARADHSARILRRREICPGARQPQWRAGGDRASVRPKAPRRHQPPSHHRRHPDLRLQHGRPPSRRPPRGHGNKATVCRSVLPAVPSLPASRLARAAGLESVEERMCAVPQHVRDVETGREYFFKAANDERGFRREVQVLARIGALADEQGVALRTSRMAGLVHWDGGREDVVMGMLLERIDGPTLLDAARRASAADKSRWMDQIDETVGELHRHGLVWGDVKPDNVMIAPSGDAAVIDFGGGGTLQYVDLQLHETREGDVQGTGKMRSRLLGGEGGL